MIFRLLLNGSDMRSSTIPSHAPKASGVAAKALVSELFDVNDPSSVVERVAHDPFNHISFAKGE